MDRFIKNESVYKDVEACIEKAGGTSKFQFIAFAMIVCGMVCGAFILYCIAYFTKEPPLLCQAQLDSPWVHCKKEVACDSTQTHLFKPDPDSDETLTNWVSTMNLYCTEDFEMSLIGSMFLVGAFVGSFILPRAADIYGRKPLFLTGLGIYILDVIALYFCNNLYLLYFLLFAGGISETGRYYVAYVYVVEMMPKKAQDKAGLYIFMVFGLAMAYIGL